MRTHWKWMACAVAFFGIGVFAVAQEPLGDVARREREKPKPQAAKVITNDDIPSANTDSSTTDSAADPADTDEAKTDKDKDKKEAGPLSAQEEIKQIEEWKKKIAAQDAKVQAVDQDVMNLERDYRLKMSAFYADLGVKLRDQAKWAEEEKKYKEDIAEKQKQRDAERTKLDDLKEEARRAGVRGID